MMIATLSFALDTLLKGNQALWDNTVLCALACQVNEVLYCWNWSAESFPNPLGDIVFQTEAIPCRSIDLPSICIVRLWCHILQTQWLINWVSFHAGRPVNVLGHAAGCSQLLTRQNDCCWMTKKKIDRNGSLTFRPMVNSNGIVMVLGPWWLWVVDFVVVF